MYVPVKLVVYIIGRNLEKEAGNVFKESVYWEKVQSLNMVNHRWKLEAAYRIVQINMFLPISPLTAASDLLVVSPESPHSLEFSRCKREENIN